MVDAELLEAMGKLTLPPDNLDEEKADKPSSDLSTVGLEKLFLSPEQRFSDEWLNKLQQYSSTTCHSVTL